MHEPISLLMVEDNPAEVELAREAMADGAWDVAMEVVQDGVEALQFLRGEGRYTRPRVPDLILLDLNLPRMNGRELLGVVKADPTWKAIPVVVLTSSAADNDIVSSYNLGANCYVTKPVDFDAFQTIVRRLEQFWFTVAKLPKL